MDSSQQGCHLSSRLSLQIKHNSVRPITAIRYLYGNSSIKAWGGTFAQLGAAQMQCKHAMACKGILASMSVRACRGSTRGGKIHATM